MFSNFTLAYNFQLKFRNIFNNLEYFEDFLLRKKNIEINDPIFIIGSPRSGTTLISEILNNTKYFGTYIQKDMPFIGIPFFWNFFSSYYYGNKSLKRFNNEKLNIHVNSPDAFEEFYWKLANSNYKNFYLKAINSESKFISKEFEQRYKAQIKKILFLRKKKRFFSKNYLNTLRVNYLKSILPSAKFILCIRNPINTCLSLDRINKKFILNNNSQKNSDYLSTIGHYEFGHNFKALKIKNNKKIQYLWNKSLYFQSYTEQWYDLYSFIKNKYLNNSKLSRNIYVLNYDEEKIFQPSLKSLASFLKIDNNILTKSFIKFRKINKLKKIKKLKLNKHINLYNEIISSYKKF